MRCIAGTLAGVLLVLAGPAPAQQSPSFRLTEQAFNAGGNPMDGAALSSASFRITLDAVGEAVTDGVMSSGSFRIEGGFVSFFPPPLEVRGLRFLDSQTLAWDPGRAAASYNLYRDGVASLPGMNYGLCLEPDITSVTTQDPEVPASGEARFYLVTMDNRLDEEGTKGFDGVGSQRPNPVACP